jgi:hypothetical protein
MKMQRPHAERTDAEFTANAIPTPLPREPGSRPTLVNDFKPTPLTYVNMLRCNWSTPVAHLWRGKIALSDCFALELAEPGDAEWCFQQHQKFPRINDTLAWFRTWLVHRREEFSPAVLER